MATKKVNQPVASSLWHFSRKHLWHAVLILSLSLNVLTLVGLAYASQQLNNPATSRHSAEILRYVISAQSTYCDKDGYDKLMNDIDGGREHGVSEADLLRHKKATSLLLCRTDYPTGKTVDDPALRAIQQVPYPPRQ